MILELDYIKGFIRMATDGFNKGWHERNGGNLSYRMKPEEVEESRIYFDSIGKWVNIDADVPSLAGEYFIVTGSGKYFHNIESNPIESIGIIQIDDSGRRYRIVWGLNNGGIPTSELPTHLLNHAIKKRVTNNMHRVIYHAHTTNIIALTFIIPLKDEVFTRQLWEMATECPVVFPEGVGVVPWMVPGGSAIGIETSKLMEKYNVVIWAHHGTFCSGVSFDLAFGLMDTVEKSGEILVKVLSMSNTKLQTITEENLHDLANAFKVDLNVNAFEI